MIPVYNIFLLGPIQFGKSTFIESAKLYADPSYKVNEEHDDQDVGTFQINTERAFKELLTREDDLEIRVEEVPGSKTVSDL
ncbi:hypothetical protein BGZ65_002387 [Modicella reniformis]|uniref:Uncharacterized protein n=1 Tax=Modicella reniformis TaxID=1440133 RepID=A0A9P6SN73_9FUNG|nr:hypothetical protein BGZ65_002387 [Modicella reniformis]